jgi:uncharacterized Zn finger protein (UPF0148 family)
MATCHGCSTSFGFLSKEVGCPSCGFSYCKKCLRYKISEDQAQEISKTKPTAGIKSGTLICRSCHDRISSKSTKDAAKLVRTLQRLESVESKPPITLYQASTPKFNELKSGLSEADQKLVERLEELRSDDKNRRKSDQSNSDVEARLARLRGEDPGKSEPSKEMFLKQKPESDSDLLHRLGHEVKLNKDYEDSLVSDIEERLAKLRPGSQPTVPVPSDLPTESSNTPIEGILDSDDDDGLSEQEQVQKLINKYVAEVALEAKTGVVGAEESSQSGEPEAMETQAISSDEENDIDDDNFCELCNENRAVLKCKTCDGDLFCKKCFHEFHVELGEIHKPTPV